MCKLTGNVELESYYADKDRRKRSKMQSYIAPLELNNNALNALSLEARDAFKGTRFEHYTDRSETVRRILVHAKLLSYQNEFFF